MHGYEKIQIRTFDLNFHQIVVEIHQNSKFLVILLNFTSTTSTIEIEVMGHAILIMNIFL